MGIGLGEITPIKLQLTRENFNALIGRHSQPIRWLVSEKCPCIQDNQKVDENCALCQGKGVTYEEPTESNRIETFTAPIDGVIDQTNVIWVRDFTGKEYTVTAQECVAYVTGVVKGKKYQVMFVEDITESGSGTAQYLADKLYRIDIPTQIAFGYVQGTILSVVATHDGTPLTTTSLFRNCFEIEESLLSTDVVDVVYTYVNPFKFALVNNSFTKSVQKYLEEVSGDGIMIFPQRWEVYEKDIIVALNATEIKKTVRRSTGTIDTLPSYYIYELKSAYVIRNDAKVEFKPNVDFVIYKDNQIKWISNPPTEGEQVSYTYSYNLVYRVLSDMPDPRTSEDNRFPRKVALKIYTDFNSREGF